MRASKATPGCLLAGEAALVLGAGNRLFSTCVQAKASSSQLPGDIQWLSGFSEGGIKRFKTDLQLGGQVWAWPVLTQLLTP